MKNNKKGFTIVELVIVVAVIAILAAVLIPTFVTLIRKSRISNDTSLVRNLNEALAEDRALNGDHITMTDAMTAVADHGYLVDRLNAKAKDNEILWDSTNDVFCYLNDGKIEYLPESAKKKLEVGDYNLWKIYNEAPTIVDGKVQSDYSIYVAKQEVADAIDGKTVDVGLDYGTTIMNAVTYANAGTAKENVIIRTNGGSLTINAPADTVNHYGYAESINIEQIATSSYHENGTVPFIKVKKGHVEIAADGWVNAVHVVKTTETSFADVSVTIKSNDVPKFSRDKVTIPENTDVKVCTVTIESKSNAIYLSQEGVYEQIKYAAVTNGVESNVKTFVVGDAEDSKMNTVADQVSNNISGEEGVDYTIDETTKEITIINTEVAEVSDGGVEAWQAQNASAFTGTGTADDPFLIYDYASFQKVSTMYEDGFKYFKVKDGVTVIDCTGWIPVYMNGSFDGNGVTLKNVTAVLFQNVGKKLGAGANTQDLVVKNFTAELNIAPDPSNPYSTGAMIKNIANAGKTTLKDITIHGTIDGYYNLGSFFNYGPTNIDDVYTAFTVELNNCKSDATLICSTGNSVGAFIGHPYCNAANRCTLTMVDCEYTGRAYVTGSAKLYAIAGIGGDSNTFYNMMNTINGQTPGNHQNYALDGQYSKITEVKPTKTANGYTVAKQTETKKVIVSLCTQLSAYDAQGQQIPSQQGITTVKQIAEIANVSGSSINVLDSFTSVVIHNEEGVSGVEGGVLHIYNGEGYESFDGVVRLQVNQYKGNGEYVSAGTIDLATKSGPSASWIVK